MIEVTFPVVARGFRSVPRARRRETPYFALVFFAGLALWSSMAAVLYPILYADVFSRL